VALTTLGLIGVGAASIVSGGAAATSSITMQMIGIGLCLVSQAILALEAVIEERVMQGSGASPDFVCGMVGVWCLVYSLVFFLPVAQMLPGEEGNGLREDSIDTLYMIWNSNTIKLFLLLCFVVILVYNLAMRVLIKITQATTVQVLGGMRSLCVWVAALLMYFVYPQYGEQWRNATWIELAGFVVLMTGVFTYKALVKWPCFSYSRENLLRADEETKSENDPAHSSSFVM